jgi:hypothetical protein
MESRMPVTCAALALVAAVASSSPPVAAQPAKAACIAANESAQDLRRAGKLRAARGKLVECVAATCPGPIREDCATRLAEVEAATPTLVLEARDEAGHDVAAVRVTMDGQPFAARLDGAAVPTDPGEHTFTFEAEGHPRLTRVIVVREGDKARHERVTLAAAAAAPSGPDVVAPPPPPPPPPPPEPSAGATPGSTQRLLGLVLGGAGVTGLAVGGIFGVMSKSTYDSALSNECTNRDPTRCTPNGQNDGRTAHQQATVSTVAFAAGGALLAGGVVLYLVAPRVAVAPAVGTNDVGVTVAGAW